MSLSKSFCTKECILALFAVQLMALRVTVLCLGSDLACVTIGSDAKQKTKLEADIVSESYRGQLMRSNIMQRGSQQLRRSLGSQIRNSSYIL